MPTLQGCSVKQKPFALTPSFESVRPELVEGQTAFANTTGGNPVPYM